MQINKHLADLNITPKGVIHIGAHQCEERDEYLKSGMTDNNIIWVEAIQESVNKINIINKNIKIYQALLTDKSGELIEFNISNNNGASSSIFEFGYHTVLHNSVHFNSKRMLTTTTFTDLLINNNININGYNILNIDVQGSELKVFKGIDDKVFRDITIIFTEFSICEIYKSQNLFDEIIYFLKEKGFSLYDMYKYTVGWGDACFVKTDHLKEVFKV